MRRLFIPLSGLLRAALARRPTYAAVDLALFTVDIRL